MRGTRTRKTIEQRIADGSYRADRHGYISKPDEETLKEIKNDLYTDYILIKKELKKLDLSKDDNLKKYELLNEIRIGYIKAFHNIAKAPVETKDGIQTENNADGFKSL